METVSTKRSTLAALSVLSAATYVFTLANGFALDDFPRLVYNTQIASLENIVQFFRQPTFPGNLYRPLADVTYALTFSAVELNPLLYHATNALLHLGVVLLVYSLCARLFGEETSAIIAVLFAVHPLHVEVVANVTNRTELLAALFIFIGLLIAVRTTRWSLIEAVALAGATLLALLSKESAACIALLVPLCLWLNGDGGIDRRRLQWSLGAVCVGGLLYAAMRFLVFNAIVSAELKPDFLDNPLYFAAPLERGANAFVLLGKYIAMMALPWPLSADYSFAKLGVVESWVHPHVLLPLCVLALWLMLLVYGFTRERRIAFWCAWIFAAFVVSANVVFPIGTIFAERLAYIPSLAVCGLVAHWLRDVESEKIRWGIVAVLVAIGVILSGLRSHDWRNNESLHSREIHLSPSSARAQCNYGVVLRNKKHYRGALYHFRRSLAIYPNYDCAAYGLGSVYLRLGNEAQAEHWMKRALEMYPNNTLALKDLGLLELRRGNLEGAEGYYRRVVAHRSSDNEALMGLLAIAIDRGDLEKATKLQKVLLARIPDNARLLELSALLESIRASKLSK